MMTTPQDLEDFAIGFGLSEGIINSSADVESLDVGRLDDGVELRMWLSKAKADRLQQRRRHIARPTGCGLCGIDSIVEAMRSAAVIQSGQQFSSAQIMGAMQNLPLLQKLNIETRAVHAAAFWDSKRGIVALREDVGRHNALDKLSGVLARACIVASNGIILLTSRVSVEMVQKSDAIGAPAMVSVSAPTALAVRMADLAVITLAAIARADGFEVFTYRCRIFLWSRLSDGGLGLVHRLDPSHFSAAGSHAAWPQINTHAHKKGKNDARVAILGKRRLARGVSIKIIRQEKHNDSRG
jgi:FdhD protein